MTGDSLAADPREQNGVQIAHVQSWVELGCQGQENCENVTDSVNGLMACSESDDDGAGMQIENECDLEGLEHEL
jgi:hypothetical protein